MSKHTIRFYELPIIESVTNNIKYDTEWRLWGLTFLHIDIAAGQIPHIYGDNDLLPPLTMNF